MFNFYQLLAAKMLSSPSYQPIVRGDGNDIIIGKLTDEFIDAGNGNNKIVKVFGNGVVRAGDGNDDIALGFGNDKIDAGDGNNFVSAGSGDNDVMTGSGDDKIITLGGADLISSGAGNDIIFSGWGDDTIYAGAGNDKIYADFGNDRIDAGAGDDCVDAGAGNDFVRGGRGNDFVDGGLGNDVIYGDGAFDGVTQSINFADPTAWQGKLSTDGKSIDFDGATVSSGGGVFSANNGLGILSPSDIGSPFGFVKEIDAYNDTPESVSVAFDDPQAQVSFSLGVFFIERPRQEFATLTVELENGTTKTVALAGTLSGNLDVTIDGAVTGGQLITGFKVQPNDLLSEFTLKKLSFETDANATGPNEDYLYGGLGNDTIDGGYGNDKLSGGLGDDMLNGGQGVNSLCGGLGKDVFAFDHRATGVNYVEDFSCKSDRLSFTEGVTVTAFDKVGCDLVLTLNTGGKVVLDNLGSVNDWHALI